MDPLEDTEQRTESLKTQPAASKERGNQKVLDEIYSASKGPKYKNDFELNMRSSGRRPYQNGEEEHLVAARTIPPEAGKETVGSLYKESSYSRREEREEAQPVVPETSKVLDSPCEWDEWTTNSEESSTISVLQSDAVKGAATVNKNETFHHSESFDFLRAQHLERKEDKTNKTSDTEIIITASTFRPIKEPRHHDLETLDNDSDSSTFVDYSEKGKKKTNPREAGSSLSYRRDLSPHYLQERRDLSPHYLQDRRDLSISPTFRSRDSSATRFVAIDAYLGIKEKDSAENKDEQKHEEKKDRNYSYRNNASLETKPFRENCSSLERNKNIQKTSEEAKRDEEADIKEDLCSSLLSIKTREEVTAEGNRYSQDYLAGLKRLTAVDCTQNKDLGSLNEVDSIKYENSLGKNKYGYTDDSKSYYKSKQLLSENAEVLKCSYQNSRSSTPTNREGQHKAEDQSQARQELPGFLAKTPQPPPEPVTQESEVHFESEFPTFSAYLKRTYGQTYSYRTREGSEENPDHHRTKTEQTNTVGSTVISDDAEKKKIKGNQLIESKSLKEESQFSDSLPPKKESRYKEVEHNSRKSNYLQGNKDIQGDLVRDVETTRTSEANNFLSRSRESVFETYGEVSSGSTKQLTKNSSAGLGKGTKVDQREASPTIDLLQRSFESLQSALSNKELDLMAASARRMSPSPERFTEERRSDSSHSRSRSRTRKRTMQSQPKSRDSSQKLRLKEMAPTYYEARHGEPLLGEGQERPDRYLNDRNKLPAQNLSPSLSEIEVIYKGSEPENYNLNKKYIERYPMDFNDEDISVMKKFIHHKKDELPEMFYMDVDTFKKYYVHSRVMEMKRESSQSRRSSLSSMHEIDTLEREASLPRESKPEFSQRWPGEKEIYHGGPHQPRNMTPSSRHQPTVANISASNIGLSQPPIEYGSPDKRSVAVQMQDLSSSPPPLKSRTRHRTLAYGVAGDDMKQMRRDCGAQVSQEQIDNNELYYEVVSQQHQNYSQKQHCDKSLEVENKKLTVINDDLLKLWEQTQAENTKLRLELSGVKNENETLKHQLGSAAQQVSQINAVTDAEKREKQIVLKKLAEMEEELKLLALSENLTDQTLDQLKADNARLRQENEALIRAMTGKHK